VRKSESTSSLVSNNDAVSHRSFSYADALVYFEVARDVAMTETYWLKCDFQADSIHQRDGPVTFDNTDHGKVKRAIDIMGLLPGVDKTTLFDLAGWTREDRYTQAPKPKGPSKLYMKVDRAKKRLDKLRATRPPLASSTSSRAVPSSSPCHLP
jgi:hypothetical protein